MSAAGLFELGFKALYPLVPLTRDGADVDVVRRAAATIERRAELGVSERADHLTVLRFLAEAEDVPVKVLQSFLSKEQMMQSSLYREIFQDGKAEGKAEGKADSLIRLLAARLGRVSPEVRQAIQAQAQTAPDILSVWFDEAALASDAEAAQRLIRKITAA